MTITAQILTGTGVLLLIAIAIILYTLITIYRKQSRQQTDIIQDHYRYVVNESGQRGGKTHQRLMWLTEYLDIVYQPVNQYEYE